ncbi:hypothetical protein E4U09_005174 [Claviceps aff. purpurea]|uniref:Uncharacterized protein n=2 Tax=Claviceps TaxID=5110 RepID=M1WBU5_CLAP2|nr:hypothetical protein E4U12_004445 [Claviceps purpurea]KAG6289098.1 hypothetical protein E4U09_005174 [Claviceps aff. purpurea]CCE28449.1 uncharacterized protein CPUR_01924 [Claviceps purpurea 20.1]KAG6132153.1 hypothetical protein E4U38_003539 [Claviceps purpurea]KAG6157206.1 hypothetical protein E4U37_007717 [Claviceps purpurea]
MADRRDRRHSAPTLYPIQATEEGSEGNTSAGTTATASGVSEAATRRADDKKTGYDTREGKVGQVQKQDAGSLAARRTDTSQETGYSLNNELNDVEMEDVGPDYLVTQYVATVDVEPADIEMMDVEMVDAEPNHAVGVSRRPIAAMRRRTLGAAVSGGRTERR